MKVCTVVGSDAKVMHSSRCVYHHTRCYHALFADVLGWTSLRPPSSSFLGLTIKGLFRASGETSHQAALRKQIDDGALLLVG